MFEKIDLSVKLDPKEYAKLLPDIQLQLVRLQQEIRQHEIPVVIMYEGVDAGGKGGSIARIVEKMDPRGYTVWPIGVPTDIEKAHHYLWRFWHRLPGKGQIGIYDRSWYGRVLVERVEKLATTVEWERAYQEINDFERTLVDNGYVIVKFWMQISKAEQLKRFKEREADPFKNWKITPDDWRNRKKWDEYMKAAEDLFNQTSTEAAPWHIIPAECKRYARVVAARAVINAMQKAIDKAKESQS
jgi:polyphosphate kinase 2 (PPK2 family)